MASPTTAAQRLRYEPSSIFISSYRSASPSEQRRSATSISPFWLFPELDPELDEGPGVRGRNIAMLTRRSRPKSGCRILRYMICGTLETYGGLRSLLTCVVDKPAAWNSGVRMRMRCVYGLGSFVHVSPRTVTMFSQSRRPSQHA